MLLPTGKKLIKKLVKNKATTSSGHKFKFIGKTMENGTDLLESTPVQVEDVAKEYEQRVSALNTKGGAYQAGRY